MNKIDKKWTDGRKGKWKLRRIAKGKWVIPEYKSATIFIGKVFMIGNSIEDIVCVRYGFGKKIKKQTFIAPHPFDFIEFLMVIRLIIIPSHCIQETWIELSLLWTTNLINMKSLSYVSAVSPYIAVYIVVILHENINYKN